MNDFTFTGQGFSDYLYWQGQDKRTLKKINALLADIQRNGAMQGIGKPEPLKHRPMNRTGLYMRLTSYRTLSLSAAEDTMRTKTAWGGVFRPCQMEQGLTVLFLCDF